MKVLALETSTETASLALLCDGQIRSVTLLSPPSHSATVLPALRRLLDEAGVSLSDLDVIACGIGPGAFTGVRLACSVTQGLALGADIPVAPVCSLLALAQGQSADRVYCAMDARMSEIYVGAFERSNGTWVGIISPCCVPSQSLPEPSGNEWLGVGTAFQEYPGMATQLGEKLMSPPVICVPTAQAIAELAGQVGWVDAALLAPLYVRDRVAQTVAERLATGGRA